MRGIIFIAGYGRSGSTLLDLALGLHPSIVSLGEALWAPTYIEAGLPDCTCGVRPCPVWSHALGSMGEHIARCGGTAEAFVRLQRRLEFPVRWRPSIQQPRRYGCVWTAFFEAVGAMYERPVWVVDSSKTTSFAAGRARMLTNGLDLPVLVVDLRRRTGGVLSSLARGTNSSLERRDARVGRVSTLARGAIGLGFARTHARRAMRNPRNFASVSVAYEDLVGSPARRRTALRHVLNPLDLELADDQVGLLAGEEHPVPGHVVSGNRMRLANRFSVR